MDLVDIFSRSLTDSVTVEGHVHSNPMRPISLLSPAPAQVSGIDGDMTNSDMDVEVVPHTNSDVEAGLPDLVMELPVAIHVGDRVLEQDITDVRFVGAE